MQERAIETRRNILAAAAKVFEEHGYKAATIADVLAEADVTKGALYFHFPSKESLADGVLREQDEQFPTPERAGKLQQLVDTVMVQAYRLQTDCMARAGVRLTLDQRAGSIDRKGPFARWADTCRQLLETAQRQGEVFPHVVALETAEALVGSFAGIQAMSQAYSNYADLTARVGILMRHLLPGVAHAPVLASLDLSEDRGERVFAEVLALHSDEPDRFRRVPVN
ncbi:ScbR family autoregulator-binding transcription factor [Actinacidiphila acididurans]|uniref:ScbR family autoregulator-binding transcription factor n=1 Tax=Actinacidiphila acididurans TaxID=2784346 RepID=UPI0027DB6991|nr:ScbR family autoregulator-binding transcription factor [Actinacidiphila acididurans]